MSICGFLSVCLLAILFSNDKSNEGKRIRFASIARSSVAETKDPSATVPPKLEITKTENPKTKLSMYRTC